MNYYLSVFKKYATFSGRARRSEYWYFGLFNLIIVYGLAFLAGATQVSLMNVLLVIYYLVSLIPGIAVSVRRMHDVGKSGWYILIPIYNLVLACTNGTVGENAYGEDPKGVQLAEEEEEY